MQRAGRYGKNNRDESRSRNSAVLSSTRSGWLVAQGIPDSEEREWTRRQIAEAIGSLVEVAMEITRSYPDLNLHRPGESG